MKQKETQMAKDFTATIRKDSERAKDWEKILGPGIRTVHLISPIPERANLPGHKDASIYYLDLDLLTTQQRDCLVQHISNKFGISEEEVKQQLLNHGVPILADDITISVTNPLKWF